MVERGVIAMASLSPLKNQIENEKRRFLIPCITIGIIVLGMVLLLHLLGVRSIFGKIEYPIESPYIYPDSVWVSVSPGIVLHVSPIEGAGMDYEGGSRAYIIADGEKIPVEIMIQRGRYVHINDLRNKNLFDSERTLIGGHCATITNKKVVIQLIDEEDDKVYGGRYKYITLVRMKETGNEAMAIVEEMFPNSNNEDKKIDVDTDKSYLFD